VQAIQVRKEQERERKKERLEEIREKECWGESKKEKENIMKKKHDILYQEG